MSSHEFCLRSLSERPGHKVFSEVLLHLRSHHRGCGRTRICFLSAPFYVSSHSKSRLQSPLKRHKPAKKRPTQRHLITLRYWCHFRVIESQSLQLPNALHNSSALLTLRAPFRRNQATTGYILGSVGGEKHSGGLYDLRLQHTRL